MERDDADGVAGLVTVANADSSPRGAEVDADDVAGQSGFESADELSDRGRDGNG